MQEAAAVLGHLHEREHPGHTVEMKEEPRPEAPPPPSAGGVR